MKNNSNHDYMQRNDQKPINEKKWKSGNPEMEIEMEKMKKGKVDWKRYNVVSERMIKVKAQDRERE